MALRRLNLICAALVVGVLALAGAGHLLAGAVLLTSSAGVALVPVLATPTHQRTAVANLLAAGLLVCPLAIVWSSQSSRDAVWPLMLLVLPPLAARFAHRVAVTAAWTVGTLMVLGATWLVLGAENVTAPVVGVVASLILVQALLIDEPMGQPAPVPEPEPPAATERSQQLAFLATVGHELRTPLNAVIGGVDLLRVSLDDPRQKTLARQVATSARLLLHLIGDLLDLNAWDTGRLSLASEPVDLMKVVSNVRGAMAPHAAEKGLELRAVASLPEPALVQSDRRRLEQLLYNLVGNAIKYTRHGSVTLRIDAEPTENDRLAIRMEVRDTGPGISEDDLKHIFQRFYRAESNDNTTHNGAGIGLAVVQHLVTQFRGGISVSSKVGQGTSFVVTLELDTTTAATTTGPTFDDASLHAADTWSVLILDDGPLNLVIAGGMITHLGGEVHTATSVAEALTIAKTVDLDVVLMDFHLPDGDGIEATARLRAEGLRCPVIGLSASSLEELQLELANTGWDLALVKPLTLDALRDAITKVLGEIVPTA